MTFANPVLPDTKGTDCAYQKFSTPSELGHARGGGLLFCGHFDGHDTYRRIEGDEFVLVYGNSPEAVFQSSLQRATRWLQDNGGMSRWGSMRAVVKGRAELIRQIDEIIAKLNRIKERTSDDDSFGVFVCDTCFDAADLLETFRDEAGLAE